MGTEHFLETLAMVNGIGRLAAVVMVGMAGLALAQPKNPPMQPPAVKREPEAQRLAITVEFSGGTVAEYVVALKEACKPNPVNVVLSEGAAADKLAPISLRQASLAAAMQAIPAASASGVNAWQIMRLMDALPGEDAAGDSKETAPVYQVYRSPGKRDAGPSRVIMEVFSVQKIVGRETDPVATEKRIAAVLTAAETTLNMGRGGRAMPEMKFHKESGLLIVRGEQDDVMAVKDVIERMSDDSGRAADEATRRETVARQMQINVAKAELAAKTTRSQLELAQAKLGQVEKLVAAGNESTTVALEMKAEVDRRAAALEMAMLEVEAAKVAANAGSSGGVADGGRRSGGRSGGAAPDEAELRTMVVKLQEQNTSLMARLEEMTRQMQEMKAAMGAAKVNNPPGKK